MDKKINTPKSEINYGIRIKLLLGFLVVLLLTLLVGGVGYYGVYKINRGADDLGGHWLKATTSLARVVEDTEDTRRTLLLGFTNRANAEAFRDAKAQYTGYKTKWNQDFATFDKYVTSTTGKANNQIMQESFSIYMTDADQVWSLLEEGKDVEARPILTQKSKESFEQAILDMNKQMDFQAAGGTQAVADAGATDSSVLMLLIIFVVLSLIVGAVLAIMLARHISQPLSEVTKVAQLVAEGNLNVQMPDIKNRGRDRRFIPSSRGDAPFVTRSHRRSFSPV